MNEPVAAYVASKPVPYKSISGEETLRFMSKLYHWGWYIGL